MDNEGVKGQAPDDKKKSKKGWILAIVIIFAVVSLIGLCSICALVTMSKDISGATESSIDEEVVKRGSLNNRIAVIDISGVITQDSSSSIFSSFTGATPDRITEDLERAKKDPSIKAVILKIDSPGGEVVASDIIYNEVKKLNAEKPVIVQVDTMAASGGYYIASAADYIVIHPSAITGSIGVIMQTSDVSGLYEKLGVKSVTFKSGRFKDTAELYDEDPNGEGEQIFQSLIDETYDQFVGVVSEGRGMTREEVKVLADGRIYSGRQAVDNGLADELGYFDDAVAHIEETTGIKDFTIVRYKENVGFFKSLSGNVQIAPINVPGADISASRMQYGAKMYYIMDL